MEPQFPSLPHFVGRAAQQSPPNRFERVRCEVDDEHRSAEEAEALRDPQRIPTTFLPDQS